MKTFLLSLLVINSQIAVETTVSKFYYTFRRLKIQHAFETMPGAIFCKSSTILAEIYDSYQEMKMKYHSTSLMTSLWAQTDDEITPAQSKNDDNHYKMPDMSEKPIQITQSDLLELDKTTEYLIFNSRYQFDNRFFFFNEICQNYLPTFKTFQKDIDFNIFFCEEFSFLIHKNEFYIEYFRTAISYFGHILKHAINDYIPRMMKLVDKGTPFVFGPDNIDICTLDNELPGFFKEVYDIIYQTYISFDTHIKKSFITIRNWTDNLSKHYPTIPKQNIITILLNTLPNKVVSRKMYGHLITHKLKYYKNDFEEMSFFSDRFYLFIDEFKLTGQFSGCKIRTVFINNIYGPDCLDFLRKSNYTEDMVQKCRDILYRFTKALREKKRLCQYSSVNPDLLRAMIEDLLKQAVIIIIKDSSIMTTELAAKVIYRYGKLSQNICEKAKSLLKVHHINTHLFNIIYYYRSFINEPEFGLFLENVLRRYDKLRKKYAFFSNKVNNMLKIEKLKFIRSTHNEKKSKMFMMKIMQNTLSYACALYSENKYNTICNEMFKDVKLDFFLKFYQQRFVSHFLAHSIRENLLKYNFLRNKIGKLTIYNHLKFNMMVKKFKEEIMDDLKKITSDFIDELGKDKITLVLIFAKYINRDMNLNYDNTIIPAINSALPNYLPLLKQQRYSDEEFFGTLVAMGRDIYNGFAEEHQIAMKPFFTSYARLSQILTHQEKKGLEQNLNFLFSHYSSWDYNLRVHYFAHQRSNYDKIQSKCQSDLIDDSETQCIREDARINLVYRECPLGSSRIGSDTCYSKCPTGFIDVGMYCRKPELLRRKVFESETDCGDGCEIYDKEYYIKQCPQFYEAFMFYCIPYCPTGFTDYGATCGKNFVSKMKFYY